MEGDQARLHRQWLCHNLNIAGNSELSYVDGAWFVGSLPSSNLLV